MTIVEIAALVENLGLDVESTLLIGRASGLEDIGTDYFFSRNSNQGIELCKNWVSSQDFSTGLAVLLDRTQVKNWVSRQDFSTEFGILLPPNSNKHMVPLPTELWLRISQFVPDLDLFRLATVNQLFLDLVTDRRYRQLIIDDDRPSLLIHKLAKLERDSLIAARVRSLTIHPRAVRSACLRSNKPTKHLNRIQPAKNVHWPDDFRFRSERVPIEEDVILADKFLDTLGNLHNIEEYIVEWKHGDDYEKPFCFPLLSAIWPLHAQNLRIIRFNMMLSYLCDVLGPVTGLDRVQELTLYFGSNDIKSTTTSNPDLAIKEAFEKLATFMNRLALSLQSLTISSIGHLNFSSLYSSLTYFPHLTYLALLMPCDPGHVLDPTGFHHFLHAHRAVEHFHFSPQYCCRQSSQDTVSAEDWLNRAFAGIDLRHLRSLELGLNILGPGGKRVMPTIPRVCSAAKDVWSLSIVGCIISLEDLRTLLHPFSALAGGSAPRTLVLEVHVLDVQLLDLLADLLPGLEMLNLTYRWVSRFECVSATEFAEGLRSKTYHGWKLWQLILRCSRQNDDARWPCQQAIVRTIPALR
ncbi:hypothetical protein GALMADRAFT_281866 [Galerina marginata CBS 339.88]|uniref:F-box domain-containing protein n=1 Tax=Galerina marginata (strain CBS 339.88) TaxID=685588 RepID=A0A067SVD2_GALM3|nr:hypothetical protein GALMADRAFT_281866 [Galerina marginata CBS 339.88]